MNKRIFFKTLRRYIPSKELRGRVRESDEQWRVAAIAVVTFYRYSFPANVYRGLLKYLYRTRDRFDREFKRKFGHYPSDEEVWGVNKLIIKDGIPINFL